MSTKKTTEELAHHVADVFASPAGDDAIPVSLIYEGISDVVHVTHDGNSFLDFAKIEDAEDLQEILAYLGLSDDEIDSCRPSDTLIPYLWDFIAHESASYLADALSRAKGRIDEVIALCDFQDYSIDENIDNLDNFNFSSGDTVDIAFELMSGCYDIPEALAPYIDYESMAYDMMANGQMCKARNGIVVTF